MIPNQWYVVLASPEVKATRPVGVTRMGEKLFPADGPILAYRRGREELIARAAEQTEGEEGTGGQDDRMTGWQVAGWRLPTVPFEWMGVQGPEHETFTWPGGRPAALLVHGFPDTPAGLQPLGRALHEAGWTVQGLLLPGFGPQIETLPGRRWEEWWAAIREALAALRQEHHPVLLVGYSLGGALSLGAAAESPPDGLALLAPFIWPWPRWQRALAKWFGPFLPPYVRPLRWVRFGDPRIRAGVAGLFPRADLSDPTTLQKVRDIAIPLTLFNQVRGASQNGYEQAARVAVPVLIVQGRHDNVALPRRTRLLLPRLADARYLEVEADHEVLNPVIPAWPEIVRAVLDFAAGLTR